MKTIPHDLFAEKKGVSYRKSRRLNNVALFVLIIALAGFSVVMGAAHAMSTRSAEDFARKAAIGNQFEIQAIDNGPGINSGARNTCRGVIH